MDTSRIVINTIDNSTSNVEQSTNVVGFTVVKAPKGPITPKKILAGGASKLKDIFGVSTEEYPELFEVETFNKEFDVYVSAPYSSAKVPVAYLTDRGIYVGKDKISYNEDLEKLIFEGDSKNAVKKILTEDPKIYKNCDITYDSISVKQTVSESSSKEASLEDSPKEEGLLIRTGIEGSTFSGSEEFTISVKGMLSQLNSNFKLTSEKVSIINEDGTEINEPSVKVVVIKKDNKGNFNLVSKPSEVADEIYIFISDKENSTNLISKTYSMESNLKALTAFVESTLKKDDIHAIILPKYPSERKLSITLTPYNTLSYDYRVLAQRNIIKMSVYEEGAFHNASSPIYIEGTLSKGSTSSVMPFTDSNDSYYNQELVSILPVKPFTTDAIAINPTYKQIILEDGTREFEVKKNNTEDTSIKVTSTEDTSIDTEDTSTDLVDLHNKGWETVLEGDYDDVDIFFDSQIHTDKNELTKSKFFELGVSGPQNSRFSGHIFNFTPYPVNASLEALSFGRNYWNICNLAVIDLNNGYRILSPMTGARALMQCRIIDRAMGGVAPMWENSKSMGGQLNMISPYRVKYKYTKEELDLLDSHNYNPVIYDRQYGLMCVGQKTCKDSEITDWSYIGHACAFMVFIKQVRKNVMLPQIGKKNNPYYRTLRQEQVQQYLRDRISGADRIWAEGVVDTSTADGVNDINAQRARKFVIKVRVKVDTFSEYVELNFYNEDQATTIGTEF